MLCLLRKSFIMISRYLINKILLENLTFFTSVAVSRFVVLHSNLKLDFCLKRVDIGNSCRYMFNIFVCFMRQEVKLTTLASA